MTPLIDAIQAGVQLGVSPATARKYAKAGVVPAVKLGKSWKFPADIAACCINVPISQGHTGGSDSRSKGSRYAEQVERIVKSVRKRLNRS